MPNNFRGIAKLKRLQEQASAFIHERGLERTHHSRQTWLFRVSHFWLLVIKSFIRNRCPLRASALAYTTLLALVPLLAVVVSLTSGLLKDQGSQKVEQYIDDLVKNVAPALNLQEAEDGDRSKRDEVVERIKTAIDNIETGALGVTSTIALVFVAIGLLRTIEATFNDIWGVTTGRGWVASVVQYWATITLGPIILVVVLGLTTGPQFQRFLSFIRTSDLSAEDIRDLPGLASRLTQPNDPLSTYLFGRLETPVQRQLRIAATNGVPDANTKRLLASNLNHIINGTSIYSEARFTSVTLLPAVRQMAEEKLELKAPKSETNQVVTPAPAVPPATNASPAAKPKVEPAPVEENVPRLNRLLLEAAFPHELASKKAPFFEGLAFQLLPYVVLSLAFGMFYQLMPNTPVKWRAALVGGIVGGTLWQLNNKLSVLYVSKAVTYSKIYGSLGIIPLFLAGIYFSWLILLFGAQVAYAFQNRQAYLEEKQSEGVHQKGREFIAIRLMTQIALAYLRGQKPPTVPTLAETLGVPTKLVSQLLGALFRERLVVEAFEESTGYVPARPLEAITAQDIIQALRVGQGIELEPRDDGLLTRVRGEVDRINIAEKEVASNVTLATLVKGAP
jgi:uncharacterized BrkB/YihY/UPF0761 family membrane protein/DNA-binding IscR family transcriptional regulator